MAGMWDPIPLDDARDDARRVGGMFDGLLTMGTGLAAQGIGGINASLLALIGDQNPSRAVDAATDAFTWRPRTAAGARGLQAVANLPGLINSGITKKWPAVKGLEDHLNDAAYDASAKYPLASAVLAGTLQTMTPGGRAGDAIAAGERAVVNIGLKAGKTAEDIAPEVAKKALEARGYKVIESQVRQSATEPTLVAKLDRPLTKEDGDAISAELRQEAIAQKSGGKGLLYGPKADEWGPFNERFFRNMTDPKLGYSPEDMRSRYPDVAEPVLKTDPKTGKQYMGKAQSEEAEAVAKVRKKAQKDIDAGNYTPYFDESKRAYVDPVNYSRPDRTDLLALPKKQSTIDQYRARFDTPETRSKLEAAYDAAKDDPSAHDWYAMKQLEDEYVDELGETEGRRRFAEDFADGMAATTGGADPTSNYLMAHYGNLLKERGEAVPAASNQFPYPIGGRFAKGNMDMYDRVLLKKQPLSASGQPKRYNFSSNFLGHLDRSTIDEQMSGIFEDGLLAPPGDSYGVMEGVVNDVARKRGVDPARFQDVAWAGKKGVGGKPMIRHINEAIERTSRVTGLTPEEVVRKLMIRRQGPIFGLGAATLGAGLLAGSGSPDETY